MIEYSSNFFAENGKPSQKEQFFELCVFLLLILPPIVISFFVALEPNITFRVTAVETIFHNVALIGLIAYFAWRNSEPLKEFGLNFSNAGKEIMVGVVLFVFMLALSGAIEAVLRSMGLTIPSKSLPEFLSPKTPLGFTLAVLLVFVVAFAEETIFRGYLMRRIGNLTHSKAMSVVLSSVIFALGHGYEGMAGMIVVGCLGLLFALIYLWRKTLVAPMTMHFLQDFIGIVILPLLNYFQ